MIGDWPVKGIESIRALERRRIARLPVPGLLGDLQQDLGTSSLVVEILGSLHGDTAREEMLEKVRASFLTGTPVTFVADITTATALEEVVVEEFEVSEVNDSADGVRYRMILREYVEPPPPPAPFDELGLDLVGELDLLSSLGLDGLELPGLLGLIPDIADPVQPVLGALDGAESALEPVSGVLDGLREAFDL
jgi:hypothetical protein